MNSNLSNHMRSKCSPRAFAERSLLDQPGISLEVADPFGPDTASDRIRVMTERQLNRLVFLAVEIAGRYAREGLSNSAVSWLYGRFPLFEGGQAVHACLERDMFLRAMLVHATDAPLDQQPKSTVKLTKHPCEIIPRQAQNLSAVHACGTRASLADLGLGEAALYTITVVDEAETRISHIFAAFLAVDEQDARKRVSDRLGPRLTSAATYCRGFDPSEPIAASLLSDVLSDSLSDIAKDPTSSFAAGLDLFVQHRFAS